jgi:hypothetical protein
MFAKIDFVIDDECLAYVFVHVAKAHTRRTQRRRLTKLRRARPDCKVTPILDFYEHLSQRRPPNIFRAFSAHSICRSPPGAMPQAISFSRRWRSGQNGLMNLRSRRQHKAWGVSPRNRLVRIHKPVKRAIAASPARFVKLGFDLD